MLTCMLFVLRVDRRYVDPRCGLEHHDELRAVHLVDVMRNVEVQYARIERHMAKE